MATAPAPRGPWRKHPGNPILRTGSGVEGPGHNCVVRGPDGVTPYVVYHGYLPGQRGRKVHLSRLFWAGGRLEIAGPTRGEQPVPPGPVFDPAIPHWHAGAWVSGSLARVGGVQVALPPAGFHHLRATASDGVLRVCLDGLLRYRGALVADQPQVAADGEVRGSTLTSWLEDEAVRTLAEGARHSWAWGGRGPVDLAVAVRGRAIVTAGAERVEVETEGGGYKLVRLAVPGGAERCDVQAGPGGAMVTDLTMAARSAD